MCDQCIVTDKPIFTRSLGYIASIKDSKTSKIDRIGVAGDPLFDDAFFPYEKLAIDRQALESNILKLFFGNPNLM